MLCCSMTRIDREQCVADQSMNQPIAGCFGLVGLCQLHTKLFIRNILQLLPYKVCMYFGLSTFALLMHFLLRSTGDLVLLLGPGTASSVEWIEALLVGWVCSVVRRKDRVVQRVSLKFSVSFFSFSFPINDGLSS